MPTQVIMPQLGESVIEGTISKWLVEEGTQVNEYDPLVEVNTDKVDTEIPSPTKGVLLKILVDEGAVVEVGTNLAWIGSPGEAIPDADSVADFVISETKDDFDEVETIPEPKMQLEVAHSTAPTPGRDQKLGFISPVVAKIASEQNVDLTLVAGTGQNGRITKKDILAYINSRKKASAQEAIPSVEKITERPTSLPAEVPVRPGEVVSLTPVRRAIAEHMVQSKHTSPHVTTIMEADLSQIVTHRESHKSAFASDGIKLTFTAYFVAASIAALEAFPIVNSSWSDEGIVIHKEKNIGLATSLGEAGLIVPVIKNADTLSLLGIARSINDLADRARAKQLNPDEVQGGTFTITNHGISGSLFATPIINQPQCGILGVGAIQKRVVAIGDAIGIRPMVYLSLTFDHRILDGASADYFLAKVVESLENWTY